MSTETWLEIISWIVGGAAAVLVPIGGFVLHYAVRIAADTATIKAKVSDFEAHVETCEEDRHKIWAEIHLMQLQSAANSAV